MISSIFGKNKPANFIIIFIMVSLFTLYYRWHLLISGSATPYWQTLFILIFLFITVFVIDIIDRSNHLANNNSYLIFFFSTSLFLFPDLVTNFNIICSNLLVTIALARLLGVRRNIKVKQRLFDSSLLILCAGLFYNWAILFLLVVWIAVIFYSPKSPKNLLIPIVAIMVISTLVSLYYIGTGNGSLTEQLLNFSLYYNSNKFNSILFFISASIITIFSIISIFYYLYSQKQKVGKYKIPELFLSIFIISISVSLIRDSEEMAESIFLLMPFSVFITIFTENVKKKWLKEGILFLFASLPFIVMILRIFEITQWQF